MRLRNFCLRMLALGLASVFVLPSCFTSMVWRQTDTYETVGQGLRGETYAAADGQWIAVRVEPQRIRQLEALVPGLSAQTPWLIARPTTAHETVARLLAWRAAPDPAKKVHIKHATFTLALRDPYADRPATAALYSWLGGMAFPENSRAEFWYADGVRRTSGLYGITAVLDVPLEVTAAAAPPMATQPLDADVVTVEREQMRVPGPSVLTKIVVTPAVLLIDAVLLPIELIAVRAWW